jgi:hypothetical protein
MQLLVEQLRSFETKRREAEGRWGREFCRTASLMLRFESGFCVTQSRQREGGEKCLNFLLQSQADKRKSHSAVNRRRDSAMAVSVSLQNL